MRVVVGRPTGAKNRSTREVKALIDDVGAAMGKGDKEGMTLAVRKLFERAHGVLAVAQVAGQPVIYEVPPDVPAIRALLEFRFGKPKESIEVTDPEEKWKGMPQIVMMPPRGWGQKK